MQSSTAIAFRALVMLVILISVPVIALFGKDLPDIIKGLMEGRGLVLGPPRSTASNWPDPASPSPDGSAWDNSGPYRASRSNPPGNSPASLAQGAVPSGPAVPAGPAAPPVTAAPSATQASLASSPAASAVPMDGNTAPAPSVYGAGAPLGTVSQSPPAVPPVAASAAAPAAPIEWHTAPDQAQREPVGPPAQPADGGRRVSEEIAQLTTPNEPMDPFAGGTAGPTTDGQQFRWAERRLRELGATHYMLETWGAENNRYRFVCQMAIGGNQGANRYFQAIDDDPWRAMEGVLKQVEAWRLQASQ